MSIKNEAKISTNPNFDVVKIKTESNFGVLKTIVVALLIVLQFATLLISFLYLFNVFKWLVLTSFIITVTFCVSILSSNKTGQIKATWIFFMLLCFTFGWVIYLISNEKVMFGKNKKRYLKNYKRINLVDYSNYDLSKLNKEIKNDCKYFNEQGHFPAYSDSKMRYYSNGSELFDDILEDLKKAKKFIFIEYFIVSSGVLLNRFISILEKKVSEGVDVRIIYDDMGSHGTLKRKEKKIIKSKGIKLQAFNKLVPVVNFALNLRDHRKIVVIDGCVSYTGGANLADEYVNEKRMYGYWKDCGIRIEGKSTSTFTLAFLRQWEFLTREKINYDNYLSLEEDKMSSCVCVPYLSGPDYTSSVAEEVYENIISNAKERIYIMTPYFIPDESLLSLLKNKAMCGVDVRIILPEIADKKFVYLVTLDNVEKLMKYGVKVYLMKNSFVHSKVVLSENCCVVGSINMDQRSFYQQFESAVYSNDASVMEDIEKDFEETIGRSKEHTLNNTNIIKTILVHILRIVSPLM